MKIYKSALLLILTLCYSAAALQTTGTNQIFLFKEDVFSFKPQSYFPQNMLQSQESTFSVDSKKVSLNKPSIKAEKTKKQINSIQVQMGHILSNQSAVLTISDGRTMLAYIQQEISSGKS